MLITLNKKLIFKKIYYKKINFFYFYAFLLQNFFLIKFIFNTNFFSTNLNMNFFLFLLKNFFYNNLFLINFKWFKFSLFSGLGFKKKIGKKGDYIYIYIGDRHWLVFKIPKNFFFFTFRRRNFIIYSNSKTKLYYFNNIIKELKFISIFKLKGYVDARTLRRWLFVRRLKIKGIKLKLSKKQKLI